MTKIKVLKLETWMRPQNNKRLKKFNHRRKETQPIFNRDGYYLINDYCWFEVEGKAYVHLVDHFKYSLYLLSQPIYRGVEYDAMLVMSKGGLLSNELLSNLYWYMDNYRFKKRLEKAKRLRVINDIKEMNIVK